ncbi:MAG: hypothetical protein QM775_36860 [Pirellulales bacterium]
MRRTSNCASRRDRPTGDYVTPEGETFAVEFPDDPQETAGVQLTPLGEAVSRTLIWTSDDGRTRYEATVLRLPRTPTAEEAASLLLGDEAATVGGRPGRARSLIEGDDGVHFRSVVAGDRLYQLSAKTKKEPTADDRKFLESLRLPK